MDTGKNGAILVIEDEEKISGVVARYLEREGFSVVVADTGKEALKLLTRPFDLIILDLMLPDMAGEDICRAVREASDVPVIMLTAKSGEEDRIKGLGIGADDYVVKPFSPRELVARVKALLRRTRRSSKRLMSFNSGRLTLDTENFEACRDGAPVVLTPTEFRLLVYLAQHPNQALTRSQILDSVWGYDADVDSERAVNVHIRRLREKIELDPSNPALIMTVPSIGYRLVT